MQFKPITVVNKHHGKTGEYIGRGSPLGNKWTHLDSKYPDVIKVESRAKAVELFRNWLREQIDEGNQVVIGELERLAYMAVDNPLQLQCFCKPAACHGDVIKEFIEEALRKA